MEYAVLVCVDSAGPFPLIIREGEKLLGGDGLRWRFVAGTEDHAEAIRLVEALERRRAAGQL